MRKKIKKWGEQRKNVLTVITFTMEVMVSQAVFEYLANVLQNYKYFGLFVKHIDTIAPPPPFGILFWTQPINYHYQCQRHHLF
jgi:hypothetical protein